MQDIRELYQEVIIDHNRNPHNFHEMAQSTCSAHGDNPLCGDKINLYLAVENNIVQAASFLGTGCAISTASASMMTDAVKGKTVSESHALFKGFHEMLTENNTDIEKHLGKLAVLAGVRTFPSRIKCATLAWHTLLAALKHDVQTVTTE